MNERQNVPSSIYFDATERDSLSARFEREAVVNILKARFSDYSDEASSLTVLTSALVLETL